MQVELVPPRSLFRASKGRVLYEMDLSQAELRWGTRVSGSSGMREAIVSGDPHAVTCHSLFGYVKGDADFFQYRQVSKRANFGLIYSIGPDTFKADIEKQTGLIISRNDSAEIINDWNDLYPEFRAINRRVQMSAERRLQREGKAWIEVINGVRRYFKPGEELHKAFNAKIQGGIAYALEKAALVIDEACPETLLLQVHDSLVAEIPEEGIDGYGESAEEVAHWMSDTLAKTATDLFHFPMESDVKTWK